MPVSNPGQINIERIELGQNAITGPTGPQGPRGDLGPQGPQGERGLVGPLTPLVATLRSSGQRLGREAVTQALLAVGEEAPP